MKLLTEAEKAKCVLLMDRFKSPVVVQRKFRSHYNTKYAPSVKSIKKWYTEFQDRGHMKGDSTGRKLLGDAKVQQIKIFFDNNPKTSLRQGARELNIPFSSVYKTLRKTLRFYPYKIKLIHSMKPEDGPARKLFADTMLRSIQVDQHFLKRICFSDEATFHVAGIVNRHNVRIWGTSHPREYVENERNSPKVNVWCGLLYDTVIGPFFQRAYNNTGIIPSYASTTSNSRYHLATRWSSPSFRFTGPGITRSTVSRTMDWQSWPNPLASP